MLYYDRIDVLEGSDVNKSKSKECIICHYWYFLDWDYKNEPEVCYSYHDILILAYEFLNIKGVEYTFVIWNMSRSDVINRLNNSGLDDKGSFWNN